jgi:hypothetical protein
MDWRRPLILAAIMLPLAVAWWNALVPAAAQAARCVGIVLPGGEASDFALPCDDAGRRGAVRVSFQVYVPPTPTNTSAASPTPYVSPTRPPGRTSTPTATGQAATTATPTPTQTRTVTPTGAPAATNTNTPAPAPGTPTATRTLTPVTAAPTATATRVVGTPTATLVPGTPTTTVGLPRTGDGTYRGDGGPSAGLLLAGGAALTFAAALIVRARRGRLRAQ